MCLTKYTNEACLRMSGVCSRGPLLRSAVVPGMLGFGIILFVFYTTCSYLSCSTGN